jgi:hypothetical protein
MNNRPARRQRGAVTILVALMLTVLLAFAALAIDIGYAMVVRNELQNAADAAAMTGAGYIYKGTPQPNFDLAREKATAAIAQNQALKEYLSGGQVHTGFWNVTGSPAGLQYPLPNPGANDLPAVEVRIGREGTSNGGPVNLFLGYFAKLSNTDVSAHAVAAVSYANYVGPSGLFPIAIASCMYDTYWDSAAKAPRLATSTDPLVPGGPAQVIGQPYIFWIGSAYHYATCASGEWTSFDTDDNNVGTIRDLIASGNRVGLGVGDNIWIETGTKNTIFNAVNDCSAAGDKSCEYVTIPVVSEVTLHERTPIVAFACVHILLAKGGSDKYIQLQMTSPCTTPNSGGAGTPYGATTPPRLVQ